MQGFREAIDHLRDAANGEPSGFAKLLQKLLTTDYDAFFYHVKTQKFLLKRRSSDWISRLESEMLSWLVSAPLKGKEKAQVTRHFAVCKAIQELFEIIDKQACTLRIWQASTKNLLQSLFASVEDLCSEQEARVLRHEFRFTDALSGLRHSELLRMELRSYCDYVARIVNQVSQLEVNHVGDIDLSPADIKEAVGVAVLEDMVLHVLDCYTYKNFRVSVQPKRLQMHGLKSQFEQSLTWSKLRAGSREIVDNQNLAHAIQEAANLARGFKCESESFSHFLESGDGVKILQALQPARKEYTRRLKRDVIDLIDLDLILRTRSGTFRADELLECWSLLFQVATCARIWCRTPKMDSIAVVPFTQLLSLIVSSIGCTSEQGERLVSQFSLDPSERNQDPFFRPLIKLNGAKCLIAGTFIETSRFSRNLFTIAIREGKVDFSPKGLKPLRNLYQEFVDAGFRAVLNFPIRTPEGTVTDVDVAAAKDGFLFVGQTKVLIHPDSVYDDWKVLDNLRKAAGQLKRSLPHISLLEDRLGLSEAEFLIVPFLLTNVWGFTGAVVEGFKVIDFSYLSMLLTGGEIWKVQFGDVPSREIRKLIRGKYPTGEELSRLLRKPIHEAMFQKPKLETRSFSVGDWTVTVPVDLQKKTPARRALTCQHSMPKTSSRQN